MPYLVRKISRGRWPDKEYNKISLENLDAEPIGDLKTSGNTLSTWEIENFERFEEAVLALAANMERIEKMDIISIDKELVSSGGFEINEDLKGNTPVKDLIDTHKNIENLSYKSIGEFALVVIKALEDDCHQFILKDDVIKIIKKAIQDGRLTPESLKPKAREQVNKIN